MHGTTGTTGVVSTGVASSGVSSTGTTGVGSSDGIKTRSAVDSDIMI
jgi:hypothetical protein